MLTVDEALSALERGDDAAALRALRAWAARGDISACHMLGYLYDVGRGTRRNRRLAMHWYRRAYRRGSSISATNIATMYRDAARPRLEFKWHERAARLGDADAHVEVACRYIRGAGVAVNRRKAQKHLRAALASDHITAHGRKTAGKLLADLRPTRRGV
ncbi:MAG: sel1 repeat family protein [Steroidobacteraceae bacterium]|nr:sel1 repeat family protein [Steroidobacteraceae bacterium]MCW5572129.1 sel1 repeat family protein [Steroidobacteraceae bacterium]